MIQRGRGRILNGKGKYRGGGWGGGKGIDWSGLLVLLNVD